MQKIHGSTLYSASDLVNFLECEHLTTLDLVNLDTPLPKADDDEQAVLIQKKGLEHEARYLQDLQESDVSVFDAKASGQSIAAAAEATKQAMAEGVSVIFQGCLHSPEFVGYVDFLRRVDHPSGLGSFSYEVVDTKLARSPKAKFIIQLCLYSDLLSVDQGFLPQNIHVVLGDRPRCGHWRASQPASLRRCERRRSARAGSRPRDGCGFDRRCEPVGSDRAAIR
jgi:uncharacterized protein